MNNYLIDTNILIYYLRDNARSVSFLQELGHINISVITVGEIFQGAKNNKEIVSYKDLLADRAEIFHLNEKISHLALSLVEKHIQTDGLNIVDALIAATAMHHNFTLVTANYKHFKMIKGLEVEKWSV